NNSSPRRIKGREHAIPPRNFFRTDFAGFNKAVIPFASFLLFAPTGCHAELPLRNYGLDPVFAHSDGSRFLVKLTKPYPPMATLPETEHRCLWRLFNGLTNTT